VKGGSNALKNVIFGYHMQKLQRGRCSKIVSSIYVHIDFGDVHIMMMVVLGKVQFWIYPPDINAHPTCSIIQLWLICVST